MNSQSFKAIFKTFCLSSSLVVCGVASASPMSTYNLILQQDYNFEGGDVEGRTLVGGNLNAEGFGAVFGSRITEDGDALSVVGDITATNLTIERGDVRHAGNLNVGNINMNGGGTVNYDASFNIDSIVSELNSESSFYAGLSENASFNSVTKTFEYDGTDALAVFDVSAADIFAQNSSLSLDYGLAETVIINVSGADILVEGGVNLVDGFRPYEFGAENILWNFYEADSVNFNSIAMSGSVLAIGADVSGGAVFDGSVAAKSYTGGREFHQFLFNPPTVEVPTPATFAFMLLACFGGLVLRRQS
ncbi:choice-of-anchor A family protein [Corallincola luteus]|uniref:Choice-of-anchor A family protein n=2 Tax=Corallincola TaxID=1775176 RepID=A0A368NLC1_9GAMM|nr:choice-of-anchor A family protein [Corallincola holothuriorum]TCI05577.1 choice-of-anchor A family protein [Corallincola luteus]